MNPEQLESLPREERIKVEVDELLEKATQRLEFLQGFERSEKGTRDIRGNLKESKVERIQRGAANDIEVASHENVVSGINMLTTMVEQLQSAHEAIQSGHSNIDPLTRVSDVLEKQQKVWRDNFTTPEKE